MCISWFKKEESERILSGFASIATILGGFGLLVAVLQYTLGIFGEVRVITYDSGGRIVVSNTLNKDVFLSDITTKTDEPWLYIKKIAEVIPAKSIRAIDLSDSNTLGTYFDLQDIVKWNEAKKLSLQATSCFRRLLYNKENSDLKTLEDEYRKYNQELGKFEIDATLRYFVNDKPNEVSFPVVAVLQEKENCTNR